MGDLVVFANAVTVTSAMATSGTYWQPAKDVLDIAAYGRVDVQAVLLGLKGASATGIDVAFYTAMQNEGDDSLGWVQAGSPITLTGSAGTPEWGGLIVAYSASDPLFRFLRWKINLKSGTTAATFSLSGIARVL